MHSQKQLGLAHVSNLKTEHNLLLAASNKRLEVVKEACILFRLLEAMLIEKFDRNSVPELRSLQMSV